MLGLETNTTLMTYWTQQQYCNYFISIARHSVKWSLITNVAGIIFLSFRQEWEKACVREREQEREREIIVLINLTKAVFFLSSHLSSITHVSVCVVCVCLCFGDCVPMPTCLCTVCACVCVYNSSINNSGSYIIRKKHRLVGWSVRSLQYRNMT